MQKHKAVIISYVDIILANIINIVYTPMLLRTLGDNEYGVYSLCVSLVDYIALFSFGYGNVYFKYYSELSSKNDEEGVDKLNGTLVVLYLIIACLMLLVGWVLTIRVKDIVGENFNSNDVALIRKILIVMIMTLAVNMPFGVLNTMIAARERFVYYRMILLLRNICPPLITMVFLLQGFRSLTVAVILLFSNLFLLFLNIIYCLFKLNMRFVFGGFSYTFFGGIIYYSVFIMLQSVIDCINWNADKLILARTCGSVAVTYYTLGGKINMVIQNMTGAIHSISVPEAHKIVAENKSDLTVSCFFSRVGQLQFIVMMAVMSPFLLFGRQLIRLWLGSNYDVTYYVVLLLAIPEMIYFSQSIGLELLRAKNKNSFLTVCYLLICIINIVISIPLAKAYGSIGAALGTCLSGSISWGIIANIYYYRAANIDVRIYFKSVIGVFIKFIPGIMTVILVRQVISPIRLNWIGQLVIYLLYEGIIMVSFFVSRRKKYTNDGESKE